MSNSFEVRKEEKISLILFIICAIAFLFMAIHRISLPGVQYDEILFENIALGAKTDQFVSKRIFGIPVMSMPYIGALKAYIYAPVFLLFGVSASSIRIPMILLSIITLWFVYQLSKRITKNLFVSNTVAALFATSFCFIISSKLDWGPTSIMMFLMIFTLWSFFRFIDTHRLFYFYSMLIALLLGIYDKSNFIWFSSAFGVGAMIVYRKEFILIVRKLKWKFVFPFVFFLLIMFIYVILSVIPLMRLDLNPADSASFDWERVIFVAEGISNTLAGNVYIEFLLNSPVKFNNFKNLIMIFSYLLSILIFGLMFIPYFRKRLFTGLEEHMDGFIFLYLISVIILMEMILTWEANKPHHFIFLLPYTVFITVLCGLTIIKIVHNTIIKKILGMAFSAVLAAILILNFNADIWFLRYISNEKNEYNVNWDPAIYELSEYIQNTGIKNVYSVDWGIHNQLHAFDPERNKKNYYDMVWYFNEYHSKTEFDKEWYFNTFFNGDEMLFVNHGSFETEDFISGIRGFEIFLEDNLFRGTPEEIHSINNNQGQEIYRIIRYISTD